MERLERAAKAVGVAKHTLAQAAVKAAVEAIENAKGKIVMPIDFVAQSIPRPNPKAKRAPRAKNEP